MPLWPTLQTQVGHLRGPRSANWRPEQVQQRALFDHLVGKLQKMQRHLQTERPGGLEVNDELNFRDLLHRQVGGFCTLENAAGVNADSTICIRNTGPVTHEAACRNELAVRIYGWH